MKKPWKRAEKKQIKKLKAEEDSSINNRNKLVRTEVSVIKKLHKKEIFKRRKKRNKNKKIKYSYYEIRYVYDNLYSINVIVFHAFKACLKEKKYD